MSQISDRHLIAVLARASREFERARSLLLREDQPTPEQVEEEVQQAAAQGEVSQEYADQVSEQVSGEEDADDSADRGGLLGAVGSAAGAAASAAVNVGSAAASVARFGARQVTGKVHPRHEDWSSLDVDERVDWWTERFGTGVAALVALPSMGGALARLASAPLLSTVGAAGQVLVVNAVAHEVGGVDEAERVAAMASIVLGRDLDADQVRAQLSDSDAEGGPGDPDELDLEPDEDNADQDPPGVLRRLGSTALLIRRVSRQFRSLADLLDERPQGGLIARTMRNLPGVGMLGGFLAERGGVRQASREALRRFS